MKGCGVLGTRGDGPSSGTFELVLSYWQPLGTQTGILKLFFFCEILKYEKFLVVRLVVQ